MHFLNNKRCQGVGLAAGSIAGGAALQRIEVPAAALVALKRPDLGDIRVFDGRIVEDTQNPARAA